MKLPSVFQGVMILSAVACLVLGFLTSASTVVLGLGALVPLCYGLLETTVSSPYDVVGSNDEPNPSGTGTGYSGQSSKVVPTEIIGAGAIVSFWLLTGAISTGAVKPGLYVVYAILSVIYPLSLWKSGGVQDGGNIATTTRSWWFFGPLTTLVLVGSVGAAFAFAVCQVGRSDGSVPMYLSVGGAGIAILTDATVTTSAFVAAANGVRATASTVRTWFPGVFTAWITVGLCGFAASTSTNTISYGGSACAAVLVALWIYILWSSTRIPMDSLIVTVGTISFVVGVAAVSPGATIALGLVVASAELWIRTTP